MTLATASSISCLAVSSSKFVWAILDSRLATVCLFCSICVSRACWCEALRLSIAVWCWVFCSASDFWLPWSSCCKLEVSIANLFSKSAFELESSSIWDSCCANWFSSFSWDWVTLASASSRSFFAVASSVWVCCSDALKRSNSLLRVWTWFSASSCVWVATLASASACSSFSSNSSINLVLSDSCWFKASTSSGEIIAARRWFKSFASFSAAATRARLWEDSACASSSFSWSDWVCDSNEASEDSSVSIRSVLTSISWEAVSSSLSACSTLDVNNSSSFFAVSFSSSAVFNCSWSKSASASKLTDFSLSSVVTVPTSCWSSTWEDSLLGPIAGTRPWAETKADIESKPVSLLDRDKSVTVEVSAGATFRGSTGAKGNSTLELPEPLNLAWIRRNFRVQRSSRSLKS